MSDYRGVPDYPGIGLWRFHCTIFVNSFSILILLYYKPDKQTNTQHTQLSSLIIKDVISTAVC